MDGTKFEPSELTANFRDIERVNRWMGGSRLTIQGVRSLLGDRDSTGIVSVLDVGCGTADIPLALTSWASTAGVMMEITVTDRREEMVELARKAVGRLDALGRPGMSGRVMVERADALELPYGAGRFDMTICSLLLHHLPPGDGERMVREMARVSRLGIVVNDLVRHRAGLAGALILSHFTRNRLTRNDAPHSVLRAYTLNEMIRLFHAARVPVASVSQFALYRVAVTGRVGDDITTPETDG